MEAYHVRRSKCVGVKIMSKRIRNTMTVCGVVAVIAMLSDAAQANWSETFGGNAFDQAWTFGCFPNVTGSFAHPIKDGPDDDDYLGLDETTPSNQYGSQFGMGFGAGDFADVRVGALVNVMGDASRNYSGIAARANYFIDPDGSMTGIAPGMVVIGAYTMFYHWEDGPRKVRIELMKIYMNGKDIHLGNGTYMPEVPVPGLNHSKSHYVELDVVGSGPVYVTGSIYEYKGGPLLVRTPTMVDTAGRDPWENSGVPTPPGGIPPAVAVFAGGKSGVFAINENPTPVGYHLTFDTVSSLSDGPSAVCLSPADGATGVGVDADLQWVEAAFATSRELWFGKKGAMRKVTPAGSTYDPGPLQFGQTYQWRVNQVGASGTVEGYVYTFTTEGTNGCLLVDDFESYADLMALRNAWPDNIPDPTPEYGYLETSIVYSGDQALRFEYQNQYDPNLTELTHTYTDPQDWTRAGLAALYLYLRGDEDNYAQKLYVELEDAEVPANSHAVPAVPEPDGYAVQNESWQEWVIELSEFSDNDVNLARIKKIIIRVGDGTSSGQPPDDSDMIYIDEIKVCPRMCSLNMGGDVDGDCDIDFGDFAAVADGWLAEGAYELP
jgi:hypothetical protein